MGRLQSFSTASRAPTMASFKHLSDKDLAGVMAFTRSTWSNKAAEFAQPVDFAGLAMAASYRLDRKRS